MKKKKVRFVEANDKDTTDDNGNSTRKRGKQKILPASRTEVCSEVSLLKLKTQRKQNVHGFQKPFVSMNEVLADLKKTTSSNEVDKLKVLQKKSKPIRVPLEKVHAKKIEREVAFDNVKRTLNRWDSTVKANRVADHLTFPLEDNKIDIDENDNKADEDFLSTFREQTPLEKKMAELLGQSKVEKDEKELEKDEFKLTLAELIQRRRTFAKIRAQISFKAAKAWRQKKIKSKSYHRLLRRERLKQQIKDFESLKERDPEAALKQLESLEKARAQERATLRHRNTGKWAKNQIIRAKYNTQSRAALSEQIQKNRELTKKRKIVDSSDSESENDDEDGLKTNGSDDNGDNGKASTSERNEFEKFLAQYRKYEIGLTNKDDKQNSVTAIRNNNIDSSNIDANKINNFNNNKYSVVKTSMLKNCGAKKESIDNKHETNDSSDEESDEEDNSRTIDHTELLDEQVSSLTNNAKKGGKIPSTSYSASNKNHVASFRDDENEMKATYDCKIDINPENFLTLKPKTRLHSAVPDAVDNEDGVDDADNNEDKIRHTIISEAFADDELVSEFQQEKTAAVEDSLPKDINLSLPGWGSWTGGKNKNNVDDRKNNPKRAWIKNKRLLFKLPLAPPRKDSNKGFVIIHEDKDPKLRQHLVNELPYPFTSVKGYESSIRAPIGREWVPETVHQNLIAPQIKTKLGMVIEPMDVNELINRIDYDKDMAK